MELGEKIRAARLEAGLSQRQLCGDIITRNMLSQIESGAARPSMATLQALAKGLKKPVSYFLEEAASGNQALMEKLRTAQPEQALALLQEYESPDPAFDRERYLLEARACVALARRALAQDKRPYARLLLDRAQAAGEKTPYYDNTEVLVLRWEADPQQAQSLCDQLPDNTALALMQAQGALQRKEPATALAFLETAKTRREIWYYLQGEAYFLQENYQMAIKAYLQCLSMPGLQVYSRLEMCYQSLGDYRNAYFYACKQRT